MKKSNKIFLFIFLCSLSYCSSYAQTITFTEITNTLSNTAMMYYGDSIAWGHPTSLRAGSNRILINSPVFLLRADEEQIPYLVYPGEKIMIRSGADNRLVFYINNNQVRSNELLFFKDLVVQTSNIYDGARHMSYQKKVSGMDSFFLSQSMIDRKEKERIAFLETFAKQYPVSEGFRSIALHVIRSTAIKDRLRLYRNNYDMLQQEHLAQKLVDQCITDLEQLGFYPSTFYLQACLLAVSIHFNNTTLSFVDSADFGKKYDFINIKFKKIIKDFLLSTSIYRAVSFKVPVPQTYIARFEKDCADLNYRNIVHEKMAASTLPQSLKAQGDLVSASGKKFTIASAIAANPGKLIFVDFWASWCAPCRREMPASKKLRDHYKGKNIVFFYISTDQNKKDWEKATAEEGINTLSTSFLLLDSDNNAFVKENKILTIPRYMLFGKDGKMIDNDTPRPTEEKLVALINGHLL